jgi:hypothetical protein
MSVNHRSQSRNYPEGVAQAREPINEGIGVRDGSAELLVDTVHGKDVARSTLELWYIYVPLIVLQF